MFIVLLSFPTSLATKCLFLNDKPCMVRPTLIDLNSVELKYYPFMISLNKCNGSCNFLSLKIYFDLDNVLIDEKSRENVLIYDSS